MRVVAGEARGRRLVAKLPAHVRPTTDMVKEAMFSSLESRVGVAGRSVVDLYCGSGALGIEALSRGAASCTFVDDDPTCLAAARANLTAVGLDEARATFVRARLPQWRPPGHVELVLCDAPYGELDAAAVLDGLDAAVVVLESDAPIEVPEGWRVSAERRYGGTLVTMLSHLGRGAAA